MVLAEPLSKRQPATVRRTDQSINAFWKSVLNTAEFSIIILLEMLIAGVCGGLAEYSGVSSGLIRLLVVLSGIGIFAYLLAAIIIPPEE